MSRGGGYDWDRYNKSHIAAHDIKPHEVEEVLANEPIFIETRVDVLSSEERVLELGYTNKGRVLFVAWTPRGGLIRPVTAFEANRQTARAYERRRYEEKD